MQQSRELSRPVTGDQSEFTVAVARFQVEIVRKSLHLLIALVPVLAAVNLSATLSLVAAGTIFYALAEASRRQGNPILVVSDLTIIASRERDRKGFVLGPVTLGLGAMLSLILYPLPSASIAILALAFGDGFASLVGTLFRGPKIPFLRTKTIAGSLACFAAVFLVTLRITMKPVDALGVAAAATGSDGGAVASSGRACFCFGVSLDAGGVWARVSAGPTGAVAPSISSSAIGVPTGTLCPGSTSSRPMVPAWKTSTSMAPFWVSTTAMTSPLANRSPGRLTHWIRVPASMSEPSDGMR